MCRHDRLSKIEILVVLGSTDIVVPAFAASLAHQHHPKLIVCSGGLAHQDDLLNTGWAEPEAKVFDRVLAGFGIGGVTTETQSTNTGDNIKFSIEKIRERGLSPNGICFVHKPYMTLRTKLTASTLLEDHRFQVAGPAFDFDDYYFMFANQQNLISVMVGDFQRIVRYPDKGYSARCDVPKEAADAFEFLKAAGYSQHLLQDHYL
jgi:hypothetical protein